MAEVPDLPDHEARRLLLVASGQKAPWLVGNPVIADQVAARFLALVERRRCGEPLQHIEGTVQFGPLLLACDRRALVPRPETERLWELATKLIEKTEAPTIVDLGTGGGALALACKHSKPAARVIGTDCSAAALSLARENRRSTGLNIELLEGDLFDPLPTELVGRIDLLISNPPYVGRDEYGDLPIDVRDHDPPEALIAGELGTEILERIAREAGDWLRPGGLLMCEIGETQGDRSLELFARYEPRIEQDPAGRPRYVIGRAPQPANVH